MTFIERLISLMEQKKVSAYKLSNEIRISESSIAKWKKNPTMSPSSKTIKKISDYFQVPFEWLAHGDDSGDDTSDNKCSPYTYLNDLENDLIGHYRQLGRDHQIEILTRTKVYVEQKTALNEAVRIPDKEKKLAALREYKILNLEQVYVEAKVFELPASAGSGEYIDGESPYDMVTYDKNAMPAGADFGIRITGDSMEPLINDGDIVWIKKQPTVDNNDLGIFIVDNEAFCKKLELDHKTKTVRLISLNQVYEPMIIDENRSFTIVGKVIL